MSKYDWPPEYDDSGDDDLPIDDGEDEDYKNE
jgi:hypothetical protein